MSEGKGRSYRLLGAILGTVVALALGETALRMIGFEFALMPTKLQFGWPDPVTLKSRYQVDPQLLWVPKDYPVRVAQWKGQEPTLVCMGDSCTEFGRYGVFLHQRIREQDPTTTFAAVNMGVSGWSSYQGLQQLQRDVLPMKPRMITIYYGWNDHWSSFGIPDRQIARFNLEQPAVLIGLSRLRIVQLLNRVAFTWKFPPAADEQDRPSRVSLEEFALHLTEMVRQARAEGITPVLLTAPSCHQVGQERAYLKERWLTNLDDLVPLHESYVQAVRAVAEQEQAPLVDLYAQIRRLGTEDQRSLFQQDGIHPNDEGHRLIAEILYHQLRQHGLEEPTRSLP